MEIDARIDRLEEALAGLAQAQAGTESALQALARAQAGTEDRLGRLELALDRLEATVARLAEAQARSEERLDRVEAALARLAEAQARSEERLGKVEERLDRLEATVARLAEAQARTEVALQALARQVGGLAETIGFTLEDLAREVAPAYLAQHYGIRSLQLDRRFFMVDGQELEVDLCGEGQRDGEAVTVVGEVRSRIHGRDVEGAVRQAARLASQLGGRPVTVLFGFVIHPSAREAAARLGAIVISSSGR
jgi:tetratricopeptide (TPR) repeat protein